MAPDQTLHSGGARRPLDLESVTDIISNDENEHVTDPQLRNTLYDYQNNTHIHETQNMAFMMKKRPRLCEENELPKIEFSMSHYDVKHDT